MSSRPRTEVQPGDVAIHARDVHFDWRTTPLHWITGEPYASHVMNSLNLLLPEGERMFCEVFTEALPLVKDEKLREDILGFIGQESMHAETHDKVLPEFLERHGIDPRPFVAHAEYLFRKALQPRPTDDPRAQRQQLIERIAFISALEHMFAFLGDWILNADLSDADQNMVDLFRWHGAEEVEHRNVAHDVATYFEVGFARRNLSMSLSVAAFIVVVVRGTKFLVHQDDSLPNAGYVETFARIIGAMHRNKLPKLRSIVLTIAKCAKPGYTPESVGDTAQAIAYLATSPAARAAAAAS